MNTEGSAELFHVLDTNVYVDDPTCLWRFEGHNVFLPEIVFRELSGIRNDMGERGYKAREALRNIHALLEASPNCIPHEGVPITPLNTCVATSGPCGGTLYFERANISSKPQDLPHDPDEQVLYATLELMDLYPGRVVLVTNDRPLSINANNLGIKTKKPCVVDSGTRSQHLLHCGYKSFTSDFWDTHRRNQIPLKSGDGNRQRFRIRGHAVTDWHPGLCVSVVGNFALTCIVRTVDGDNAVTEILLDYMTDVAVRNIQALNPEQSYALNALLDPHIYLVTLSGVAGTGKTLLALLAGVYMSRELGMFDEIIVTRATVPIGEDIGFLPGDEKGKMQPWMGGILDNLMEMDRRCNRSQYQASAESVLCDNGVSICSLNFLRGRSFAHKFLILDEAQNLTPKQMKALITRAGRGTKVVCMGNLDQIDTPHMTPHTSGFTSLVEHSKPWQHAVHIALVDVERSPLAEWANSLPS